MASPRYEAELETAIAAALAGGRAIKEFYDQSTAATYVKGDGSPVTDADLASDRLIRAILAERFPDDAILTEEGTDDPARLTADRCWIVDPLDGTGQFVDRTGEFDVLIALVVAGRPVVGAIYQPTTDLLTAAATGLGAWVGQGGDRQPLSFAPPDDPLRLATSIWYGAPTSLPALARIAASLETEPPMVLTTGVQPRHLLGPQRQIDACLGLITAPDQTLAWEWDFAPADVIFNEAGATFTDLWGRPHRYNKPIPRNTGGLIIAADPGTQVRLREALGPELPHR